MLPEALVHGLAEGVLVKLVGNPPAAQSVFDFHLAMQS